MSTKYFLTVFFIIFHSLLFPSVEASAESGHLQKNVDNLPMPVVDFINKQSPQSTAKITYESHISPKVLMSVIFITTCVILIYLYLKYTRAYYQKTVNSGIGTIVRCGNSSGAQTEQQNVITLSDNGMEQSVLKLSSLFAQTKRLKEERRRHTREIKQLMRKI